MEKISDVWPGQPPDKHLHVFVSLPGGVGSLSLVHDNPQNEMVPTMASITEFIVINLRGFKHWDRLCEDDLIYSEIRIAWSSRFLQDFQERLERKRYITEDAHARFLNFVQCSRIPLMSLDSYFEIVTPLATETNITELDRVTMSELAHYCSVLGSSQLTEQGNYKKAKESHVRALLEFLAVQSVPYVTCDFGLGFPFHLLIETDDDDQRMKYTPHNDFRVSIRDFPHIVLQVNSQPNEGDNFRMLLQAGCLSRIANWLRASTSNEPIVIMAIYINEKFMAYQHILCQSDVGSAEVEYITTIFDLTDPKHAFEFLFQMYNFFSVAKVDNARLDQPEPRLAEAKASVDRKNYPTFSRIKRKYEEDNPDTSSQGGDSEEDSFGNPSVQRELARAGYTLPSIPKEFILLTPLKPTICKATSRTGANVVLKIIGGSDERRLLHYFSGIKAPSNHVIPLLDTLDLSIGETVIVLPSKSPLDDVLQFRERPENVVSLCLQFIEGVAFLHRHNVAHCDLKPGNVVIDTLSESIVWPRLFIIDFGLAMSVESEETMLKGWCGTPSWIAPEIGSRNGPIRRYSPILADRWACGKMIEYFAEYFPIHKSTQSTRLGIFAQRLLDSNPRARPEFNELQGSHGRGKRKASTSQHESDDRSMRGPRHKSENNTLGSSFESPEAGVQQAIPAPDKAAEIVVSDPAVLPDVTQAPHGISR